MSVDINVFISRHRMPTPEEWQKQIDAAGFPLQLSTDFEVETTFSGYLPCTIYGEEVGFEYYFDVLEDTLFDPSEPKTKSNIGDRDICVGFSAHGTDDAELAAAVMAAGALAKHCDGVLWVSDDFIPNVDPIAWAKESIAELRDDS